MSMAINESSRGVYSSSDVATMLFRHKKKVVLVPLAVGLIGLSMMVFMPRAYQSEAKLFLQVGRETIGLDPTATIGQTTALQRNGRNEEIKSALEVLNSRGIAAKVVDQLGPDLILGRGESGSNEQAGGLISQAIDSTLGRAVSLIKDIDPISDREKAIIRVERKLHAEAQRDSTVIVVSFKAKSPQLAQKICDTAVKVYKKEHLRIHHNKRSRPFFENQRDTLRGQLDAALAKLCDAKNEMGLSNVFERRSTLEYAYKEVELANLATEQAFSSSVARLADLEKQLGDMPMRLIGEKKSIPNEGADMLRQKFYELQVKAMAMRAQYADLHPKTQAIAEQVRDAQQVMSSQSPERFETTESLNLVHQQLEFELKQQQSMLAGQKARLKQLGEQKLTLLAELRALNGYEVELDQLEHNVQIARTSFSRYADSFEQARVDKEMEDQEVSNVSVVQEATLQEKPASPSKMLIALASVMLATGGTAVLIMISEMLDTNLRTEEQIEKALGLPVLASIPNRRIYHRVLRPQTN